ncbi:MAG TPA: hydrogenase maturation protease [Thermoanaerobaculia bacterium]|nr:hydrogenase maturation protease [Thermoanaerobaculia bacterium]
MSQDLLIVGIGNVFLGDDGFGVEVVRRLASQPLPGGVRVADFGTRGLHLAFELLDRPEATTILVDATQRGGDPGTVYLIEPDLGQLADLAAPGAGGMADAHAMTPEAVFSLLRSLGGTPGRVLIVGCEPLRCEEEMGLSPPVELAVGEATKLILEVVAREQGKRRQLEEREQGGQGGQGNEVERLHHGGDHA